jgi:hypothetical protein
MIGCGESVTMSICWLARFRAMPPLSRAPLFQRSQGLRMQLWTYHPQAFRIDAPDLDVKHELGFNWSLSRPHFRYREVLPIFCDLIGTTQFVWCSFKREWKKFYADMVEWELNISLADRLRFYDEKVWNDLVWSRTDDWTNLMVNPTRAGQENIEAIVLTPLQADWAIDHGQLPDKKLHRRRSAR